MMTSSPRAGRGRWALIALLALAGAVALLMLRPAPHHHGGLARARANMNALQLAIERFAGDGKRGEYPLSLRPADFDWPRYVPDELRSGFDPGRSGPQLDMGEALVGLGRPQEALAHYRAALRLDPDNVTGQIRLAELLERLGRKRDAAAAYSRYLELVGDTVFAREVRTRIARLRK